MSTTTMNGTNTTQRTVTIAPPNFQIAQFRIRGIAPYVQNKFSEKAREQMRAQQEAGSTARKGSKREPKNFQEAYENAIHYSTEGWAGIPAPAFRDAMISACRTVGFHMTKAKLAVFIEPDGFDATEGTPLVQITKGEPHYHETAVRIDKGSTDIRPRPMWSPGWESVIRVRFDADMFTFDDVTNLMARVGLQVGIGEGRPDSPNSTGQGWGLFELANE